MTPRDTREHEGIADEAQRNEARERLQWMRERFGGEFAAEVSARVLAEAAKERRKHPDHFRDTSDPATTVAADAVWRNLGPTSSNKIQNAFTLTKVNSGRLRAIQKRSEPDRGRIA